MVFFQENLSPGANSFEKMVEEDGGTKVVKYGSFIVFLYRDEHWNVVEMLKDKGKPSGSVGPLCVPVIMRGETASIQ